MTSNLNEEGEGKVSTSKNYVTMYEVTNKCNQLLQKKVQHFGRKTKPKLFNTKYCSASNVTTLSQHFPNVVTNCDNVVTLL